MLDLRCVLQVVLGAEKMKNIVSNVVIKTGKKSKQMNNFN